MNFWSKAAIFCGTIVLGLLLAVKGWSQGLFGTISGTITDPTGAVIPNARVTVVNINTNVAVAVASNGTGGVQDSCGRVKIASHHCVQCIVAFNAQVFHDTISLGEFNAG